MRKPLHPYHVSVSEIHIHTPKKSVELSCKLFTDDLQGALHKAYKFKGNIKSHDSTGRHLIQQYILAHLSIHISGEVQQLKFIGYEIVEEACWCYFESNYLAEPKKVTVANTLFYDDEETQTHFIHCYLNKERKSFKLIKPNNKVVFDF